MKNRFFVKPADVICFCTNNHLDSCVPFIATCFIGAIASSLDPSLSLADTAYLIKKVAPKMMFVIPDAVQLIEDALAKAKVDATVVVFGPTERHTSFITFLEQKEDEDKFRPVQVDDIKETAVIFFSSGTTGFPKGVCISHSALLLQSTEIGYVCIYSYVLLFKS